MDVKKKGKRILKIPLSVKQETKNECFRSLGTPEATRCIKAEKKIDLEKIFIKPTSKKPSSKNAFNNK